MKRRKIISVVGARPNFMKVAPMSREFKKHKDTFQHMIVHTGQHYDENMSKIFFEELAIPRPDINLGISGLMKQGEQTGRIMIEFEKVCEKEQPDLVLVYGDVNSTAAVALVAAKMHIPIGHVEAGLRSFDRAMPEEINRLITDAISDHLFTHSTDANQNLKREGIDADKIHFVGNIMVDSLLFSRKKAEKSTVLTQLSLQKGRYAVLTLHRPANVDDSANLEIIFGALGKVAASLPVIFPAHPRTTRLIKQYGIKIPTGIILKEPLGYFDFLNLMMNAKFILTDSGGIQEETTVLGVPCLTLRNTTERPVTVKKGTNTLVGGSANKIIVEVGRILSGRGKSGKCPELWDGRTARRIVQVLKRKI